MAAASPPPPPTPPSASVLQPSGNIPQLPALAPSIQRVASSSAIDGALKRAPPTVHSWSSCPAAAFKVRCGPNYKANGKKAPSAGALYEVSAVDVYQSQMKLAHVGRVTTLPEEPEPLPTEAGLPTHVIINFMVPNYAPGGLLGSKKTNGPGWNLVLYCRPSEALRALFREGSSTPPPPSVDLLRRYMHPSEGVLLRGTRLKCIFGVVDLEGPAFGMVMKQMVKGYNFKPFLSKTASFCYWEQVRCRRRRRRRAPPPTPPLTRNASLMTTPSRVRVRALTRACRVLADPGWPLLWLAGWLANPLGAGLL